MFNIMVTFQGISDDEDNVQTKRTSIQTIGAAVAINAFATATSQEWSVTNTPQRNGGGEDRMTARRKTTFRGVKEGLKPRDRISSIKNVEGLVITNMFQNVDDGSNKIRMSLTVARVVLLVTLSLSMFTSTALYSVISPFFPSEAKDNKNATEFEIGLIFSTFELSQFMTAPIYGRFITQIGPRVVYVTGLLATAATTALFSFVIHLPPGAVFVWTCVALRFLAAAADCAFVTAIYVVVASHFKERVTSAISVVETLGAVGYAVGPTIGASLYTVGGFHLPFYVLSPVMVLFAVVSLFLIPKDSKRTSLEEDEEEAIKFSTYNILTQPIIISCMAVRFAYMAANTFLEPSLEIHMEQFHVSAMTVSLFFFIQSAVQIPCTIPWGIFVQKKGYGAECIAFGVALMFVAFMLIGPSPLLKMGIYSIEPSLSIVALSQVIVGLATPPIMIIPFVLCLSRLRKMGFPDDTRLSGLISGALHAATSIGSCSGPLFGTLIVQYYGFEWASTTIAFLQLLPMAILIIVVCVQKRTQKKEKRKMEAFASTFELRHTPIRRSC